MFKFEGWALVNYDKEVFQNPFKKAALFLTFLAGPDIDNWVEEQRDKLTTNPNNPSMWSMLKKDFTDAYHNTGEKVVALDKLKRCQMQGEDVDKYIVTFNRLLNLARFIAMGSRIRNMFRQGLSTGIKKACILHPSKKLETLQDWQDEARAKQLAFWEANQAMGGRNPDNRKCQMYHKMGIPHLYKAPCKDPNAMDVDTMHVQKPPDEHIDLTRTRTDG